jgi:hypothetical protein
MLRDLTKKLRINKRITLVAVLICPPLGATLAGCDALSFVGQCISGAFVSQPTYDLGIICIDDVHLVNIRVSLTDGNHVLLAATKGLNRGGASQGMYAGAPASVPNQVDVSWLTANGDQHREVISLVNTVPNPRSFDGTIWLRYQNGDWNVVSFSKAQTMARIGQGKSYAPLGS